jgi:hypothetical protein
MPVPSTAPPALIATAEQAAAEGRLWDAIAAYSEAEASAPDPGLEREIIHLRHRAAITADAAPGPADWPPALDDPFPHVEGPPEIGPEQLSTELVGGSLVHHGSVIVRSLLAPEVIAPLVEGVDAAFAECDAFMAGGSPDPDSPWFAPFEPEPPYRLGHRRAWVREGGAIWAAESPRLCIQLLDTYRAFGFDRVVDDWFGERAVLSINKFTVRRVGPDAPVAWHQDGSFMGPDARALNVWIALSDCGGPADVPGLEIVPHRVDHLVETGTPGAWLDDGIAPDRVEAVAGEGGTMRPVFAAGDALIFDERLVHSTGGGPDMRGTRYAVESWFFPPSTFPPGYVPLAL